MLRFISRGAQPWAEGSYKVMMTQGAQGDEVMMAPGA